MLIGNSNLTRIKIDFCDFWPGFNKVDNYFIDLLQQKYYLEITNRPDFLIYSSFGTNYKRYRCKKIFYTGENIRPNFKECDYAFSFDYLNDKRNYRLPLYALYANMNELIKPDKLDAEAILAKKTKFCNLIYSNPAGQKRIHFFHKLSKYKKVDSAGRLLNNYGRAVPEGQKLQFIQDYKFTIAFENSEQAGYTTEKLIHPMLVHSLPIYWGNPLVGKDFNTKSFLNFYDFSSEDSLIEKIIELDRNDGLYLEYLRQPYYEGNKINEFVNPDNVLRQFQYIFSSASTKPWYRMA